MNIPTDYLPGYEKARAIDPARASNYISHTVIGDPVADAFTEHVSSLELHEADRLVQIVTGNRSEGDLPDGPSAVRDFVESCDTPPPWLDSSAFVPGVRVFHRNVSLVLAAMMGGVLVEGFSTNIAKSFFITGRLRDQGVRRLKQNNRHMLEIFLPGGLERDGDGRKLSIRVRLVHSQIRRLLSTSEDWDHEAWGTPLSAAHLGFAITAFSARLLHHMKRLGARFNAEERESFMAVWRYTGHLMGIPETILFHDEAEALKLFRIGGMCEAPPDIESIAMANALVHATPLVVGLTDADERQSLVRYVYGVSRALIGNSLADQLKYPPGRTFGMLAAFRMQQRCDSLLNAIFTKRAKNTNKLVALLGASMFDETGIRYGLPTNVYSEESRRW